MNLSNEKYNAAKALAFDDHFGSEWITNMSGEDAKDLLLRQWSEYLNYHPGPIGWRHQAVVDVLTDAANKICTRYAEEHVESYLDEEEF